MNTVEIEQGIRMIAGGVDAQRLGFLAVNAFLVTGSRKTMLIDSGAPSQTPAFMEALQGAIDPAKLDYLFLTHFDADHIGALGELQKANPNLRIVGSIANMTKGTLFLGMPPPKFAVLFPGDTIDLGDRTLRVVPPLVMDDPTLWLMDEATRTCFTSDGFGVLQSGTPQPFDAELSDQDAGRGFNMWHLINFGNMAFFDDAKFGAAIESFRRLAPKQLATAHGPVVRAHVDRALGLMKGMPHAQLPPRPELPPIFKLGA